MMSLVRYLTHPQVNIDPAIPVPSWGLSEIGRARVESVGSTRQLSRTTQIVSSAERKAIETAEIIAGRLNVAAEVREAMHENDRSATGFLVPDEFQAVADRFFAQPQISVRGWERAVDAQSRIVREVEHILARDEPGDILFVGHGGVGTLLYCYYAGVAIARTHDQPAGGGCFFAFTKEGRRVQHSWYPLEDL
jgi:broad specificity phosphatase PhoE